MVDQRLGKKSIERCCGQSRRRVEELDRLASTDGFDEAGDTPGGFSEPLSFFGCGYARIGRLVWFFCEEDLSFTDLRRGSLYFEVLRKDSLFRCLANVLRHSIQCVEYGCTIPGEIYRRDEAICPSPLNLIRLSKRYRRTYREFLHSNGD